MDANLIERASRRRLWAVCASAFAGALAGVVVLGAGPLDDAPRAEAQATPTRASPYANLAIFARALAHIEASHVEPPDQDRLIYGAIRGMVEELDPHSTFLDPDEYRILANDTEGQFGGIGVEIDVRDGWLTVHGVNEGTPAERGGVQPGDRFLTIDGWAARDMPVSEAVRRMRGDPGTEVRIRLRRENVEDAVELTLTREVIHVEAVEARVLPDRVVYVRVRTFQETATDELRAALDRAVDETRSAGGVAGVLLDLRGNPGGLLDEAVRMSDEFLEDGVIVSTRGRGGELLDEARARRGGTRPPWPMVVLVDHFSASAAEIVAGALQDHHRAIVVGSRTWGKGSVQNIVELPDGSALKLTIARYYTPDGTSIQAHGIDPDVEVEQLDADTLARLRREGIVVSEAVLEHHLTGDREEPREPEGPARDVARTAPESDDDERSLDDDFQAQLAHQILSAMIARDAR
jgi:carboxyl-terminal processing protease